MVSAVACVVARLESRGAVEIGRPLVVIRKWAVVKAPMGTAGLTNRHHESEKTKNCFARKFPSHTRSTVSIRTKTKRSG